MLKTPAEFPMPGSEALLGTQRVRIVRIERDGRRFVTAKGIARTVDLDQLSDAATPADPIQGWIDDRVQFGTGARTAVLNLYDDFAEWAKLRGIGTRDLPTTLALGRALSERGAKTTTGRSARHGGTERFLSVALKPMQVAA